MRKKCLARDWRNTFLCTRRFSRETLYALQYTQFFKAHRFLLETSEAIKFLASETPLRVIFKGYEFFKLSKQKNFFISSTPSPNLDKPGVQVAVL